jgi:hypothetical protein
MKIKFHLLGVLAMASVIVGCQEDNYTAPKSMLSGKLVYQGEPIGVEYNQVRFQLWQPGWGKLGGLDVNVDQSGSYSSMLFNGDYKLAFLVGRGPFKTLVKDQSARDTIYIQLAGNKTLDIEVLPYYMIRNSRFTAESRKVSGSASIDKIINDADARDIERISLYINKTSIVSAANNIVVANLTGDEVAQLSSASLSAIVPAISPQQNYVFARIGVKIRGVEDMILSPVTKVDL